ESLAESSHSIYEPLRRAKLEQPDHRHRRLLPPCRERPSSRCAAEQRDERAPPYHSITSSARASSAGGTSRPSVLAALRLIARSYLGGNCSGRSAGISPFRMRWTYAAARR